MGWSQWALVSACVEVLLYGAFVAILVIAGRRTDARALAGFVPDRVVLVRRLLGDLRVSRWRRALLVALIAYLAPIDLVARLHPGRRTTRRRDHPRTALRAVLHAGGAARRRPSRCCANTGPVLSARCT